MSLAFQKVNASILEISGRIAAISGGARYRTKFARERPHDSGGPSSNQRSQESLIAISKRHGINPTTVAKWK
jgi:hypothetical protein